MRTHEKVAELLEQAAKLLREDDRGNPAPTVESVYGRPKSELIAPAGYTLGDFGPCANGDVILAAPAGLRAAMIGPSWGDVRGTLRIHLIPDPPKPAKPEPGERMQRALCVSRGDCGWEDGGWKLLLAAEKATLAAAEAAFLAQVHGDILQPGDIVLRPSPGAVPKIGDQIITSTGTIRGMLSVDAYDAGFHTLLTRVEWERK